MNLKLSKNEIKTVFYRFLELGLPLLILVGFLLFQLFNLQSDRIQNNIDKIQNEILNNSNYEVSTLLNNIYNDLNLVGDSIEMYADSLLEVKDSKDSINKLFISILNNRESYQQLRVLDTQGMEVVRVDRSKGNIQVVPESELQNKSDRYYIKSLLETNYNTLYISDFDLNIEHGEVEIPYKPTIRFGVKIQSNSGEDLFLLINYDGYSFLKIFDRYEELRTNSIDIGIIMKNKLISYNINKNIADIADSFLNQNEFEKDLYDYLRSDNSFIIQDDVYNYKEISFSNLNINFDSKTEKWGVVTHYSLNTVIDDSGIIYIRYPIVLIVFLLLLLGLILYVIYTVTFHEFEDLMLIASGYISDYSHNGIVITDNRRKIIYENKEFSDLFKIKGNSSLGKSLENFIYSKDKRFLSKIKDFWSNNVWIKVRTGIISQKHLTIKVIKNSKNRVIYYVGIYSEPILDEHIGNITPDKLFKNEDISLFMPKKWDQQRLTKSCAIVLSIHNIDYIKANFTDSQYDDFFNLLIKDLNYLSYKDGVVLNPATGIYGFTVELDRFKSVVVLMSHLNKLLDRYTFESKSEKINLKYTCGVAVSSEDKEDFKTLFYNALVALEALQKMKSVNYLVYNDNVFESVKTNRLIESKIDSAITNKEFYVKYQLQNDINTMEVLGVEALARWNNNEVGNITPDLFIPIMEDNGLIKTFGLYVLDQIIKDFSNVNIPEKFTISFNLSAIEFNNSEIIEKIISKIDNCPIDNYHFCIEITETVISKSLEQTNSIITRIHENNIYVAIDDFGTGYSSLGYLKKLDSDKLKIDRLFIKDYPSSDDGAILSAIVKLSKELNITTIIEGVETTEQLELAQKLNCNQFQGFYLCKPLKVEELIKHLPSNS